MPVWFLVMLIVALTIIGALAIAAFCVAAKSHAKAREAFLRPSPPPRLTDEDKARKRGLYWVRTHKYGGWRWADWNGERWKVFELHPAEEAHDWPIEVGDIIAQPVEPVV